MIIAPIRREEAIDFVSNLRLLKNHFPHERVIGVIAPSKNRKTLDIDGVVILSLEKAGIGKQVKTAIRSFWDGQEPIVWIDGDLPVGVDAVERAFQLLEEGYDVVWCSRYMEGSKIERSREWIFLSKNLMRIYRFVFRWPYTDVHCGCFGFNPETIRLILEKSREDGWGFHKEIAIISHRNRLKVREFPVFYRERKKRMPLSYFFHKGVLLHTFLLLRSWYFVRRGYYDCGIPVC